MILILEVLGDKATALGAGARKAFHSIGGTIGRLPDNDWVFSDPYVSGRHALIRYLNGKFFIEDTSTNGVFINSPSNRLPKTQAQPLRNGDVLYIDAYQIRVVIENDQDLGKVADDPLARLRGRPARGAVAASAKPTMIIEEDRTASLMAEDEGTEWFGMGDVKDLLPAAGAGFANQSGAHSVPPPVPSLRQDSPPPILPTAASANPGRAPVDREFPPSSNAVVKADSPKSDGQFASMLSAAGIEGVEPSAELAQTCGEVMRVMVNGLMEVLRARERTKEELRLRGTTFQAVDNNPLKFSANADDAFHNLLVKHNPAYLSPRSAFEDALHDVHDHQVALLSAIRLAFETMLAQFDPDRLQEEFDRQMKKGSILGVPAKLRYWDLFRDKYNALARDADSSYQKLFGEAFANAYEEHLERLKAKGK